MIEPRFSIGDTLYVPSAHAYGQTRIPCEICNGAQVVTLILGSGEHQPIECEACRPDINGYGGGTMSSYVPTFRVDPYVITGVNMTNLGWVYITDHREIKDKDAWANRIDAEHYAEDVLFPEAIAHAKQMHEDQCLNNKKKLTWSAHYHRSALAKHRRDMAYHEEKLRDKRIKETK